MLFNILFLSYCVKYSPNLSLFVTLATFCKKSLLIRVHPWSILPIPNFDVERSMFDVIPSLPPPSPPPNLHLRPERNLISPQLKLRNHRMLTHRDPGPPRAIAKRRPQIRIPKKLNRSFFHIQIPITFPSFTFNTAPGFRHSPCLISPHNSRRHPRNNRSARSGPYFFRD